MFDCNPKIFVAVQGELCPASNYCDLLLGLMGGLLTVLLVMGGVAYRKEPSTKCR